MHVFWLPEQVDDIGELKHPLHNYIEGRGSLSDVLACSIIIQIIFELIMGKSIDLFSFGA